MRAYHICLSASKALKGFLKESYKPKAWLDNKAEKKQTHRQQFEQNNEAVVDVMRFRDKMAAALEPSGIDPDHVKHDYKIDTVTLKVHRAALHRPQPPVGPSLQLARAHFTLRRAVPGRVPRCVSEHGSLAQLAWVGVALPPLS